MRIFYAISLDKQTMDKIYRIAKEILPFLSTGRMIDIFNYHVTLEFIGKIEDDELYKYKEILDDSVKDTESSDLIINKISSFKKENKHTIYLNAKLENEIINVRENIIEHIKGSKSSFIPHITLFRDAMFKEDFSIDKISDIICFKDIKMKINEISLKESKIIDGKVIYIDLFNETLKGAEYGTSR